MDLLAVQGTLKGLLQHHSSITLILQHSVFYMVQLSHSYMTTGKTIALTIWTFVGKVTSLLFNTLSRFVIAFLPRSRYLSIPWLQSLSAVILEPKKIVSHCFHCFPICHEVENRICIFYPIQILCPDRCNMPLRITCLLVKVFQVLKRLKTGYSKCRLG